MKFHTKSGSVYEVHQNQLRRIRDGKADEWIDFIHLVPDPIKVGSKVVFLHRKDGQAKYIMTSHVVKIEE